MASVTVRKRVLSTGDARFDVRYRRGGRGYQVEHAGTFTAFKHAAARRDLVEGWLAAGKDPRVELQELTQPGASMAASDVLESWLATKRTVEQVTIDGHRQRGRVAAERFPDLQQTTPRAVNQWLDEIAVDRKPGTVGLYLRTLRLMLEHADIDPNPARHKTVETPRVARRTVDPPDADDVLHLLRALAPRWRRPVMLIEQLALRVSEALALTGADIDREGLRLRVSHETSKTRAARWVEMADWHLQIVAGDPPFPGVDRRVLRNTMARACGAVHIHPHLLRHRRATLWHQAGVPAAELAARLGHARPSMSLDVYSHVKRLHEIPAEDLIRLL